MRYLPLSLFFATGLFANPTGEEVVSGACSFERAEKNLSIQQNSDKAIVHWQDFSIDCGEVTQISQPNASSAILNRVISNNPSAIYGTLKSNGKVYLINQNGVVIGPKGKISSSGFVAAALDVTNAEFLNQKTFLFQGDSNAQILNEGVINAGKGDVFLIARDVKNRGEILGRDVSLSAGREVLLAEKGEHFLIRVKGEGDISQEGLIDSVRAEIKSGAGKIGSLAINLDGIIKADDIFVEAENGSLALNGELEACAGEVHVLGQEIFLEREARIDVSGDYEAGTILVGGDYQGANPDIQNALMTHIEEGAKLVANARISGDGGKVIVWADDTTTFHGSIEAKAMGEKGDGGFAEVSGKEHLDVTGHASLGSLNGKHGEFLLDPGAVTIINGGGMSGPDTFSDDFINAQLALPATNLTITTATATAGAETLTINTPTAINWSTTNSLTLIGRQNSFLQLGATITSTGTGALDIQGNGNVLGSTYVGVALAGNIVSNGNVMITGLSGGSVSPANHGVQANGTITITGSGNLTVNGTGRSTGGNSQSVLFEPGSAWSVVDGDINITGTVSAGAAGNNNNGIFFNNGGSVSSSGMGNITMTGTSAGSTTPGIGIWNIGGTIQATGSGNVTLMGTGADAGIGNSIGIVPDANSTTSVATGTLQMTGTSGANSIGGLNDGIRAQGANSVITSSGGDITLTGNNPSTLNTGSGGVHINVASGGVTSTGGGMITFNGMTSTSDGVWGIAVAGNSVVSTTTGDIIMNATGSPTTTFDVALVSAISPQVNAGSGDLTFNVDRDVLITTGTIAGTSELIFNPTTASTPIEIFGGVSTSSNLVLNTASIGNIADGFSRITIGRTDGTGTVNLASGLFNDSVLIQGGQLNVTGPVTVDGNAAFQTSQFAPSSLFISANVTTLSNGNIRVSNSSPTSMFGVGDAAAATIITDASLSTLLPGGVGVVQIGQDLAFAPVNPDNMIDINTANVFADPLLIAGRDITISGALNAGANAVTARFAEVNDGTFTLSAAVTSSNFSAVAGTITPTTNGIFTINQTGQNIQALTGSANGSNTLNAPGGVINWAIIADNSGTMTSGAGVANFSNMENIVGSTTGNDTFVFTNQMGVTGSINGGDPSPAFNVLDYSAFAPNAIVFYDAATESGNVQNAGGTILYTFTNIQDVIGNVTFLTTQVMSLQASTEAFQSQILISTMLDMNPSRDGLFMRFQDLLFLPISNWLIDGGVYGSFYNSLEDVILFSRRTLINRESL